ncbi:MAG: UDP-3-O-acyl-N-acetylglucosamine deacetylase [Phycisphaerae bacterium]|nr:UDP-3-O-acyl-N-acetylglucosamine deacetylase [Phycisphaerae bacterium]
MSRQRTIKSPVTLTGRGLFSGLPCRLQFFPAPADSGVVFQRAGEDGPVAIPVSVSKVAQRPHRTSLSNGTASVETVEHVLAAVKGMEIDNLLIEVSAEEIPSANGSALPFAEALRQAGIVEQDRLRQVHVIDQAISVSEGEALLAALPGPTDCLDILFDLDYPSVPSIGRQVFSFRLGKDDFLTQLAPARTFALEQEARQLQEQGLCTHLTLKDILVMDASGPLENTLRFPDECVRHKVCDLIGDLALLGRPVCGRIVAYRSGHDLNHALVRKLAAAFAAPGRAISTIGEPVMDVRRIMRVLPHRYPFLMVDRIIQIDGDQRAVGVKNVSINEPFFQGHWPGQPVMPGVMIVEAMAQLSGVLLSRRLEHTGKIAVLLSLDRVKMRRLVRPGDQLILEAEAIRVHARTGHCRCRALVGDEVAAEADIKFMLVDAEPA